MVVIMGKWIGSDMQLVDEYLTILYPGIGIFEVGAPLPQGLYLGALEHHSGFVLINNKIIPAGFAVFGDDFDLSLFQRSDIFSLILVCHRPTQIYPVKSRRWRVRFAKFNKAGTNFLLSLPRCNSP